MVLICAAASVGPVLLLPLVGASGGGGEGGDGEGGGPTTQKRKNSANGDLPSFAELVPLKSSDTGGDSAV